MENTKKKHVNAKITVDIQNLDYEKYFSLLRQLNSLCLTSDASVSYTTDITKIIYLDE